MLPFLPASVLFAVLLDVMDGPSRVTPAAPLPSEADAAEILEVEQGFLPALDARITAVVKVHQEAMGAMTVPDPVRTLLSWVPGTRELLAMYYAMLDPRTPMSLKAALAASLVYLLAPDAAPGPLDDIGVALAAYESFQPYLLPEHFAKAEAWLTVEAAKEGIAKGSDTSDSSAPSPVFEQDVGPDADAGDPTADPSN